MGFEYGRGILLPVFLLTFIIYCAKKVVPIYGEEKYMTKSNWLVLFIIGFSTTFLGGCETMSGAMRGAQKDLGKAASFLDGKDERAQNLSVENSQYDKSHSRNRNSKRTRK